MRSSVFILRHGETELNLAKRIQGSALDAPLTVRGRKQAEAMAMFMKDKGIVALYSSPQGRAQSTAAIVAKALNLPVKTCPFLHEMNFGTLSGLSMDEAERQYREFFEMRIANKVQTRFPGGESYIDIEKRIRPELEAIAGTAAGPILFVGHEGVNRIARAVIRNCPLEETVHSKQHNDEIIECLPDGKEITHHLES